MMELCCRHSVLVGGFPNGGIGYGNWDTKSGGCTNLVHHAAWVGYGYTS